MPLPGPRDAKPHETDLADPLPDRGTARRPYQRRPAPADRGRRARLQDHLHRGRQGRARRRARRCRHRHNIQGEAQKKLDVLSNEILLEANDWGGHLAGLASEEMDHSQPIPDRLPARQLPAAVRSAGRQLQHRRQHLRRHHLLGAALPGRRDRRPATNTSCSRAPSQVCAGYTTYGPSTMLVLTVGHGTHAFTLDREHGQLRADRARHADSGGDEGIRDQHVQPAPLGAADAGLRRPTCWPARTARAARTSTCAGSPAWWPTCTAS